MRNFLARIYVFLFFIEYPFSDSSFYKKFLARTKVLAELEIEAHAVQCTQIRDEHPPSNNYHHHSIRQKLIPTIELSDFRFKLTDKKYCR